MTNLSQVAHQEHSQLRLGSLLGHLCHKRSNVIAQARNTTNATLHTTCQLCSDCLHRHAGVLQRRISITLTPANSAQDNNTP
jgi:hypothetical protein